MISIEAFVLLSARSPARPAAREKSAAKDPVAEMGRLSVQALNLAQLRVLVKPAVPLSSVPCLLERVAQPAGDFVLPVNRYVDRLAAALVREQELVLSRASLN